jgi:cytochrome c peroxidase
MKPDRGRGGILTRAGLATGTPEVIDTVRKLTGAFKTASLRGLLLTAPYFHDGRTKTLEEAAGLMLKGGIPNRHRDEKLKAWPVTPEQRAQLLAFLKSLTPESKPYARPEIPQASQASQ